MKVPQEPDLRDDNMLEENATKPASGVHGAGEIISSPFDSQDDGDHDESEEVEFVCAFGQDDAENMKDITMIPVMKKLTREIVCTFSAWNDIREKTCHAIRRS